MMKYFFLIVFFLYAGSGTAQEKMSSDSLTILFITRHAEKSVTDKGNDPGLDSAGRERAKRLANLLRTSGVQAVYATATRRAELTGKPLADSLSLSVNTYTMDLPKEINQWRAADAGKTILIVGHSNTVPEMLNILSGKNIYKPAEVYGILYMLVLLGSECKEVLELQY